MPAETRGSGGASIGAAGAKKKGKTVEEQYQKMSPLEHILKRPDTYVGSCNRQESEVWVYDRDQERMMFKTIKYAPALYKIFDEILVNAADHLQRSKEMNKIEVSSLLNCTLYAMAHSRIFGVFKSNASS